MKSPEMTHPIVESSIGSRLRASRDAILKDWEKAVRETVSASGGMDQLILLNSLPAFLDNLAHVLDGKVKLESVCFENECASHARQRSELPGYELENVIFEYHVLARTIVKYLEKYEPLSESQKDKLFKSIDGALAEVTESYVKSTTRNSAEEGTLTAQSVILYQNSGKALAWLVTAFSGFTFLGWLTNVSLLAKVLPQEAIVSPSTAFGLILLGCASIILNKDLYGHKRWRVGKVLLASTCALAVFKLFQIYQAIVPVEQNLFKPAFDLVGLHYQMTVGTAVCIVLVDLAIFCSCIRRRGSMTLAQVLAMISFWISFWYAVAYLYNIITPTIGFAPVMGSTSAIMFMGLALATLLSRPDQALMAIVTSHEPGGYIARRMVPATIGLPIVFGWLRIFGENKGYYNMAVGAALVAVAVAISFSLLIWRLARQINGLSKERRKLQKETIGAMMRREEMQFALQEVEREREIRERFVSALSHDLRSPLTAIKASSELGLRYPERHDAHIQLLQRILESAERADQMIRDLLDANRIRAGQPLPIQIEECDLRDVVERVREEFKFIYGDRTQSDYLGYFKGFWSCDAIRRIVENLCTNAIKYGDRSAPVTIKLTDLGNQVTISVHNVGKPLTSAEQKSIFDPFRRTESADRSKTTGWGLGLTLVRGLAEVQGGNVYVESSAEKGTTFTVLLPRDVRPFQKQEP